MHWLFYLRSMGLHTNVCGTGVCHSVRRVPMKSIEWSRYFRTRLWTHEWWALHYLHECGRETISIASPKTMWLHWVISPAAPISREQFESINQNEWVNKNFYFIIDIHNIPEKQIVTCYIFIYIRIECVCNDLDFLYKFFVGRQFLHTWIQCNDSSFEC